LEVFHRQSLIVDREWFELLSATAERISVAIDWAEQLEDIQKRFKE